ncbi:hypothetical protein R1sor_012725 [Riccia sorocarpa]|uniref:PH domain-containing protein n=1 Tax=Riccia sorocarpa TaxID=122646 RepID=A0ABD3I6H5_9MARC
MFQEEREDWMEALGSLIRDTCSKGSWSQGTRTWEPEEIMLSKPPMKIPSTRTASSFLQIWGKANKALELKQTEMTTRGDTTVELYLKWAPTFIDAFDKAFVGLQPEKHIPFSMLARTIWLERNERIFSNRHRKTPLAVTFAAAIDVVKAIKRSTDPESRHHASLQRA